MRLIFNKNNNGQAEIKELIPYIDASIPYKNLEPDIRTSTKDVIKLIGKELYQVAEDLYFQSEELLPIEVEFLRSIKYPILINAYRLFAPTMDLAHTTSGRKMRTSDDQKNPFEWMIDRDNDAQERRYFRALDDLIFFLDSQNIITSPSDEAEAVELLIAQTWHNSEAFAISQSLFVRTVDDFNNVFPIESRLLLLKLSTGLEDCETYEILPRLGKEKFDALKAKMLSGEPITDTTDKILLKLIKKATALYALAWSMMKLSVNLYAEGVLQHYTSDRATTKSKKPSLNIEPKTAEIAFSADCSRVLKEIEKTMAPAPELVDFDTITEPSGDPEDKHFSC